MKVALIYNPYSGGKKSHQSLSLVHKELFENGVTTDMFTSEYHGHLQQIGSRLSVSKYNAILTMGGDGTHFHVLNGILSKNKAGTLPPLGIIPVGSGNSFVRDLEINSVKDSLKAFLDQNCKWVDVCSFRQNNKEIYFINTLGLGFVADVIKKAQYFKKLKNASYLIGVFLQTIGLKFHHLELETDTQKISNQNCLIAICNSRYIGGNMLIAPDGELFGSTPTEVKIYPKWLKYLC